MNLYGILCWWDESPTWLTAAVASMGRVGVDHVIAVDGRYPHFQPGKPVRSRPEQVEAIQLAAAAIGAGVTIHQPIDPPTEVEKRTLAFQLLETLAVPLRDWCFILDSDELVVDGHASVRRNLHDLPADVHVARALITNAEDPHAAPGADNDVRPETEELYQKMPQAAPDFTTLQSRFFRVLHGMNTGTNHWSYNGLDADGVRWFLRNDTGQMTHECDRSSELAKLDTRVEILHRKNHRIANRQRAKAAYYELRDSIGLEA
jgi:hypothetical protein